MVLGLESVFYCKNYSQLLTISVFVAVQTAPDKRVSFLTIVEGCDTKTSSGLVLSLFQVLGRESMKALDVAG